MITKEYFNPLTPKEWPASNFSQRHHQTWIKHLGYKSRENDNQLKELLIVEQILLISTEGNA